MKIELFPPDIPFATCHRTCYTYEIKMALTCKSRIPDVIITEIVTQFLNIIEDGEPVMQAFSAVKGFENINAIWLKNTSVETVVTDTESTVLVNGKLHSWNDVPAKITEDGTLTWYYNGVVHRVGHPALVTRLVHEEDVYFHHYRDCPFRLHEHFRYILATQNPAYYFPVNLSEHTPTIALAYYKDELEHSYGTMPAVEWTNDNKHWKKAGLFERADDKPTIERADGTKIWTLPDGRWHRDGDRPAFINVVTGECEWYQYGKIHRDNDRPATVRRDGLRAWYRWGKLHRANGKPAYISRLYGIYAWYLRGLLHRKHWDQPAYYSHDEIGWYRQGRYYRAKTRPAGYTSEGGWEFYIDGERVDMALPKMSRKLIAEWCYRVDLDKEIQEYDDEEYDDGECEKWLVDL